MIRRPLSPLWRALPLLACLAALAGCHREAAPPPPTPSPHYLVGTGYELGGIWYYPAEDYALDAMGLAVVQPAGRHGLTANGEAIDDSALTAAMQTLQLPSIVTVTNLHNGLQIQVRVNDRGPANPGRLIALSPRAGQLLHIDPATPTQVRVVIDANASRQLADALGGGPNLAIATAPTTAVIAEDLPAPGQARVASAPHRIGAAQSQDAAPRDPGRLPETLRRVGAIEGRLFLDAGHFGHVRYAVERAARLAGLGGNVVSSRTGRDTTFFVRAGPYDSVEQADRALAQARLRGINDARIVVQW